MGNLLSIKILFKKSYTYEMKNKLPTFVLILSLITLVGFSAGDEIELDNFLRARTSPNFLKYTKNVATTLSKGTTGKVLEIKKFPRTGNAGIKMEVTSGPKSGESYWVYYNTRNPALKLADKSVNKVVTPTEIQVTADDKPQDTISAETLNDINASRVIEEIAVEQTAEIVVDILSTDALQDVITPANLNCPQQNPASDNNLVTYSPQSALADINHSDLKFIGRELMPGFSENKSCVYQNEKVYVIYNHCMDDKKEYAATDIEVISKEGGTVRFYVEIFDAGKKTSQLQRNEYEKGTFSIEYSKTLAPGDLNISKTQDFIDKNSNNMNSCFIGLNFKVTEKNTKAVCMGKVEDKTSEWAKNAESFWQDPPAEWYATQNKLKTLVENTSF